jgi:hypothetical protein
MSDTGNPIEQTLEERVKSLEKHAQDDFSGAQQYVVRKWQNVHTYIYQIEGHLHQLSAIALKGAAAVGIIKLVHLILAANGG